jgi:hypothetical protein
MHAICLESTAVFLRIVSALPCCFQSRAIRPSHSSFEAMADQQAAAQCIICCWHAFRSFEALAELVVSGPKTFLYSLHLGMLLVRLPPRHGVHLKTNPDCWYRRSCCHVMLYCTTAAQAVLANCCTHAHSHDHSYTASQTQINTSSQISCNPFPPSLPRPLPAVKVMTS